MRQKYLDSLRENGWISENQSSAIQTWENEKPFSLHWELRTILYVGILLVTSGLGIIIYQNIDTIGHTAIITLIAIACSACFFYCFTHKLPYSNQQVKHASPWFDYVLLLGCLLFLALEGYLQYQYQVFGVRYGIATLLPAILFFFLAYYFDHAGVLSMGIAAMASFFGITVSPGMLVNNQLEESPLIYTGLVFAILLIGTAFYFKARSIKRHFTFTYYNFGFNMLFICLLAGCFTLDYPYFYFGLILLAGFLLARYAILEKSFYFLLMTVIYCYIGITWAVTDSGFSNAFGLYYYVFSAIGVIYFLINYKKILKHK
ncbi:MAG: DUF2157 domain-containing protein [Bacteroidetes bacterium]|nr:DUF2157 domain-containing protein [Bacteroidota bacterium]